MTRDAGTPDDCMRILGDLVGLSAEWNNDSGKWPGCPAFQSQDSTSVSNDEGSVDSSSFQPQSLIAEDCNSARIEGSIS